MPDNPSPGEGASGEADLTPGDSQPPAQETEPAGAPQPPAPPQPWFPPGGASGAAGPPPPAGGGQQPPGAASGQPGWYTYPGGGQPPPAPGSAQPGWHTYPGGAQPPPGPGTGQPGWYTYPGGGQPPPAPGSAQPGWYTYPGPGGGPPYPPWPAPPAAPKPGVIPLRPLGVGEILDGAFTSVRRNPWATLGIAAVLLTIYQVFQTAVALIVANSVGAVQSLSPASDLSAAQVNHLLHIFLITLGAVGGVALVLGFVVDVMLTGLLTVVIGRLVLGRVVTPGEAWRLALPRLGALIGVTLLTGLVAVAPWAVLTVVLLVLAVVGVPGWAVLVIGIPGAIAAFGVMVGALVMFWLAGTVVVLEREPPVAAMRRSWRLVRGSFWRVLGIGLLTFIIVGTASSILQLPFAVLSVVVGGGSLGPGGTLFAGTGVGLVSALIAGVGRIIAESIVWPILAGVAVLLYVDLRMRREGLDLVLQTASAGSPTGDEFASLWRPGATAGGSPGVPAPPAGTASAYPAPPGAAAPPGTAPPGPPAAW